MKAITRCHFHLKPFDLFVGEFNNFSALGAYHMIVVPAQMAVFITDGLPLKMLPLRKPQLHHSMQAVFDKARFKIIPFFPKETQHLFQGDVFFRVQKNINNIQLVLNAIVSISLYQRLKISFFKKVVAFHGSVVACFRAF